MQISLARASKQAQQDVLDDVNICYSKGGELSVVLIQVTQNVITQMKDVSQHAAVQAVNQTELVRHHH